MTKNWGNFNSVLAMTTSIFDKTPLPYVPETCSEWELKRDIIRYNLKSNLNFKAIASIFGHTKGQGWFMLPYGWWYKPREVFEVAKIGIYLLNNIILTSLPLWLTEPFMCWLNPEMKKRRRVKNYDPSTYVQIDWDRMEVRNKAVLLKKARDQFKDSGTFNVTVKENNIAS